MQANRNFRKGCHLFVVQIFNDEKSNDNVGEEEIEVLKKYIVLR